MHHRIEGYSDGYVGTFTLELTPRCQDITHVPRIPGVCIRDNNTVIVVQRGKALSRCGGLDFSVGQKPFSFSWPAIKRLLNKNGEVLWQNNECSN